MQMGWIKLHRSMKEWEWYSDKDVTRLFLHLLLSANHKEGKWKGITINPGQILTGRKSLSKETGLSEQKIRSSLDKLKSTHEITIKTTNRNSLITLVNWETYQENNQQITNKQPTVNQQLTTNKNVKNNKNEKNDNNLKDYGHFPENEEQDNSDLLNSMLDYHEMNDNFTLQQQNNLGGLVSDETAIKESFNKFWDAYAKKKKPKDCLVKWKSKKLYLIADQIMADIDNRMKNCHDWRLTANNQKERRWQPHPLTYLNSEGWKSDLTPPPVPKAQKQSQFESKEDRIDRVNAENKAKIFGEIKTNQTIDQDFIEGECHEQRER